MTERRNGMAEGEEVSQVAGEIRMLADAQPGFAVLTPSSPASSSSQSARPRRAVPPAGVDRRGQRPIVMRARARRSARIQCQRPTRQGIRFACRNCFRLERRTQAVTHLRKAERLTIWPRSPLLMEG
jgi:hypothetical protein